MSDSQNDLSRTFVNGIWTEIPVFRLILGMCPTLAVTTAIKPGITMGLCVIFVLVCSGIVVSLMRNILKPHLRILMFTLAIASFVTIADLAVKAYLPEMSEKLGPYIPLIIVNCIIICRAEACASKSNVITSIVDALSMGLGFTIALCVLASIREILSAGSLLGKQILPLVDNGGWFTPWAAMAMPVGAFVTLGLLLGLINHLTRKKS